MTARISIIGVGRMGELHLRKFSQAADCHISGIFDPNRERTIRLGKQFGVPVFKSIEDALNKCDGVVIASPTHTHFDLSQKALRLGRHVLVEKPMTTDSNQAERLAFEANQADKSLLTGFVERYRFVHLSADYSLDHPVFIRAERLSKTVGREPDVDVISDLMIHDLDLINSIMGQSPSVVTATGAALLTDTLDEVIARLHYDNGAVVELTASRVADENRRYLSVGTTTKTIEFDFLNNKAIDLYLGLETLTPDLDPLALQADHFVECILGKCKAIIKPEDGLGALELVQRVQESALDKPKVGRQELEMVLPSEDRQ